MKGILAPICALALMGSTVVAQNNDMTHNDMFYHHHPDLAFKESMATNQRYSQPNQAYANNNGYAQPDQVYANNNGYAQPNQAYASNNGYAQPDQVYTNNNGYAQPDQVYANNNGYAQPNQGYNRAAGPFAYGPAYPPPQRYGLPYVKRANRFRKRQQGGAPMNQGGGGGIVYDENGSIDWTKSKVAVASPPQQMNAAPPPQQMNAAPPPQQMNAAPPPQQMNAPPPTQQMNSGQSQQGGGSIVYDENGSIDWTKSNVPAASPGQGAGNMPNIANAAAAPAAPPSTGSSPVQQDPGSGNYPYQGYSYYSQGQDRQYQSQPQQQSQYNQQPPGVGYSGPQNNFYTSGGGQGGANSYYNNGGSFQNSGGNNYASNSGGYNNNEGSMTAPTNLTSGFAAGIRLAGTLPDDGYYRGEGTFYDLETHVGTCGKSNKNTELVAALNAEQMGDDSSSNENCGKEVEITGPTGKTVQVTIVDNCKTCKPNGLDLSPAAFEEIGEFSHGSIPIKWKYV